MLPGLLMAVFLGTEGGPAGGLLKAEAVSFGGVLSEAVACRNLRTSHVYPTSAEGLVARLLSAVRCHEPGDFA